MSIDLTITMYRDPEGNDKYKVQVPETMDSLVDVTDQYECVAVATPDGRPGFAFFRKDPEPTELGCLDANLEIEP